uniref:Pectinesterase n=1 Tax=Zea mays TaxID=4577 RepID=A0A804QYZ6_MAIZE
MGMPRARSLACIAVAAIALLAPTRGAEMVERQFVEWVRYMGGLRHSTFQQHALDRASPSYSLVVDANPAFGDFTTIQAAVDSLPDMNLVRVVIRVNPGTYTEKVSISAMRAFITLEGAGADSTIVQWGDTADSPTGAKGRPLGTFNSASFAVNAQYFLARNITFKNTSPVPRPGATGKQAVALRVSADNAAFVGCSFLGAQDTLYDHSGRHYYKECYIQGSVDFIFGNALSLYEDCHVHAIALDYGALTAQNRQSMLEDTGFSFVNCRVTGSGALYLGRAWGTFSRVVFAYTYMDDIIIPKGWYNWGDPNRELYVPHPHLHGLCYARRPEFGTKKMVEQRCCRTVFYGQYKCTGPGATYAGRVAWSHELTDDEARPFVSLNFIDGNEWIML